ncbi:P27 family phage terminase small subunit [Mesorhizobium sp. LjNodule214]|uniref:P27 family phage terminase small subunit n=1 Tax=Mesorhizobium sp. LjNodule214 TaxID=3342252 RepID=UPI003ECFFD28
MAEKAQKPPAHLSPAAKKWFRSVIQNFDLDEHHVLLLVLACEALDRGEQARITLAAEGVTFIDRFGSPRAHPCVAIERDSRTAYARLLRELSLDFEDDDAGTRPPALADNRGY